MLYNFCFFSVNSEIITYVNSVYAVINKPMSYNYTDKCWAYLRGRIVPRS